MRLFIKINYFLLLYILASQFGYLQNVNYAAIPLNYLNAFKDAGNNRIVASDAKVPEFIIFIVKDMRGGSKWLDMQCLNRYGHSFIDSKSEEQLELLKEIAYPLKAKPEMHQSVIFFNPARDLTALGFYTKKTGIDDVGYVGNRSNKWEGAPHDVLP